MPSAAEEKRRKRLEAWRRRQASNKTNANAPKPKKNPISLSLSSVSVKKKRKRDTKSRLTESKRLNSLNLLGEEDDEDSDMEGGEAKKKKSGRFGCYDEGFRTEYEIVKMG